MFLFHFIGSSSRFNARREYAHPASHVVQDPPFSARCPLVSKEGERPTPGSRHYSHDPPQPPKWSVQLLFGGCGLPVVAAASTTTYPPFQLPESSSFSVSLAAAAANLHMPPPKSSVLHSFRWLYASLAAPTNCWNSPVFRGSELIG